MRFKVCSDRATVVVFEPTADEHRLDAGATITIEWPAGGDDGLVSVVGDMLVVWAPSGGYTRAWRSDGTEIYVGPESGPDAS
ncbi:hypothetical protein Afil01_15180 [Actinorhabdospora filicis]|uniref:Uncharacterized protein n=1 Tax=Actinorhabdospora filicis TaxID=1785913 RepID=A0A9W6SJE5_9ACTN|nr:hypothetical protein [Actinorhabdospora filicis]GLZ76711.1 hypothetical protein Afil01_15180 [Actinorhabdospora filicis]